MKFDTLKYDLQKFIAEAKTSTANLSRIMDDRKVQRVQRVSQRMKDVSDVQTATDSHLSKISDILVGILRRLQQDRQLIELKEQLEHDLRNRVSRENALDRCRDRLNRRLQQLVENDRDLRTRLDAIWDCLSQIADGPGRLSLQVGQPTWTSEDFQLDENFAFSDNDLRSTLVNPSLPSRMIICGLLGAAITGCNGGKCKIIQGDGLGILGRGCWFLKSWPNFRPKYAIFRTCLQTWPLQFIPVFRPLLYLN